MQITLDNVTTDTMIGESTSQTISHIATTNTNLIVVAVSSVFKTVAPNSVTWNGIIVLSQGAITSPNGKAKVELYALYNPGGGTHNIVVSGSDVFAAVTSVYSFTVANRNPIQDIQTQTGTTGQNPSFNLSSTLQNFTICAYADDGGANSLTLGGSLTARGANKFNTANCHGFCGGSSIVGQGSVSATWVTSSTSWVHLGVSLRCVILASSLMSTKMVDANDPYQWMSNRRP